MENENHESQLNKIRALLAKAESTDFPKEVESYTAKAMELVAKWGIDQSLLEAQQKTSVIGDRIFKVYAPYAPDKIRLFNAIVNTLGGRGVHRTRAKRTANPGYEEIHVFGTETDLARIDLLFTSLLVQCMTALNAAIKVGGRDVVERPRKFKSDFIYGFAQEVAGRLLAAERRAAKQAEQQAREQGMSTDLVLVAKKDQVDQRVEGEYPVLINRYRQIEVQTSGYRHGQHAGMRADLGETRINTGAKKALIG